MVCDFSVPGMVICGPPRGVYHRAIRQCYECKRRHRFIITWDGAWYGTTLFGSCGDRWMDGELGYRPFEKGWRKKAQEQFRDMWQHAAPIELFNAYADADVRFAVTEGTEWERACDDRDAALAAIHAHQGA